MSESDDYWSDAQDTFVADAHYYRIVGEALERNLVPRLTATTTVLDVGCGDGHFTEQMARNVASVDAYDISPSLISHAKSRELQNVTFTVGDIIEGSPASYDVVVCMGVLVCLTDDGEFATALRRLASCVQPGGLLVLRETVSPIIARSGNGPYEARYRTPRSYRQVLCSVGMTPLVAERLVLWSRLTRLQNWLWVYQAPRQRP